jgi:hypothetical protein
MESYLNTKVLQSSLGNLKNNVNHYGGNPKTEPYMAFYIEGGVQGRPNNDVKRFLFVMKQVNKNSLYDSPSCRG